MCKPCHDAMPDDIRNVWDESYHVIRFYVPVPPEMTSEDIWELFRDDIRVAIADQLETISA